MSEQAHRGDTASDASRPRKRQRSAGCDEHAAILIGKGRDLHDRQRFEAALRCFDRALVTARTAWFRSCAWNAMGTSLRRLGRHEEAIACCDLAIRVCPTEADAWVTKGNCLRSLGRFEDALTCYDRALLLEPRDHVSWFNKALVQDDLGRDAISCYEHVLAVAPPAAADMIQRARQRLEALHRGALRAYLVGTILIAIDANVTRR